MILLILAGLGLAMGSFISALTWRTYKKKDWVKGRSQCPHCGHQLAASDLVPLFSWLALKGRCRYCKKPISWQYPAIELGTMLVFTASYLFWPGGVTTAGDWLLFTTWLACSVGLMALLVYDARWLLLPSKILYPTALIAASGRLIYIAAFEADKLNAGVNWLLALAVASGFFWVLYMVSSGRWIGFGDVRLGLVTGTLLANPSLSFLMIFLASVLGLLFVIPDLLKSRKALTSHVPYGPFLITATFLSFLFGDWLINWYKDLILL